MNETKKIKAKLNNSEKNRIFHKIESKQIYSQRLSIKIGKSSYIRDIRQVKALVNK